VSLVPFVSLRGYTFLVLNHDRFVGGHFTVPFFGKFSFFFLRDAHF